MHTTGAVHQVEVAWWPPTAATALEVRAEISDLAGNPAVTSAQVATTEGPVAVRPNPPVGNRYVAPSAGRITSCRQGLGSDADKLLITWETDASIKPGPRPITLSYSETLGGPWTTIAGNLDNTGRFNWVFGNRIPPHFFLRLEIRDEMGNIGIYETPDPFALGR